MSGRSKPLLSVKHLQTCFHTLDGIVKAVDGIDFDVYPGETLGLVGESGCGKSVTAFSILKLLRCPPAEISGRVLLEGANLLNLDKKAIRKIRGSKISMIFQEPMTSLNPVLKIGEQVAEGIRVHEKMTRKESWRWAVEMLRMVQIASPGSRSRQYPHKFSGGMRQRAMIAIALSCKPKLILADEPTTALDVTIQAQIMNLMLRLKKEFNTAMILITHDLGIIAEMASRVLVMYAGKIVEEAPVKELYKDPRHPYTRGLLNSVPVIGRKFETGRLLREIPGMVPGQLDMPPGCRFSPRCEKSMNICRSREPHMFRICENRRVSCWLEKKDDEKKLTGTLKVGE